MGESTGPVSGRRPDRRRARTRGALLEAAKRLIIDGHAATATIQQITDTADIGFGSFYNHFSSKEELFHAATAAVLEEWGQLIEDAARDIADPAERFATSLRISARLAWTHPALADVLNQHGLDLLELTDGLGPRALRDIAEAVEVGRFDIAKLPVAMSVVGGSLLGFLRLRSSQPGLVEPDDVEELTRQLLVMLGLDRGEATTICDRPLPELGSPARP